MAAASTPGYYRQPTLYGNNVVFVCEDDLWAVDIGSTPPPHVPRRLTVGMCASSPRFSPDGAWVAFTSALDDGEPGVEVFVVAAAGGPVRQMTFLGAGDCRVVAWGPAGEGVVFCSDARQSQPHVSGLFVVPLQGGSARSVGQSRWVWARRR